MSVAVVLGLSLVAGAWWMRSRHRATSSALPSEMTPVELFDAGVDSHHLEGIDDVGERFLRAMAIQREIVARGDTMVPVLEAAAGDVDRGRRSLAVFLLSEMRTEAAYKALAKFGTFVLPIDRRIEVAGGVAQWASPVDALNNLLDECTSPSAEVRSAAVREVANVLERVDSHEGRQTCDQMLEATVRDSDLAVDIRARLVDLMSESGPR